MKTQPNTKNSMKRGAAYCRFSCEMQRDESIDAQLYNIYEYAKKNNIVIVREYCDRAKSATTDQRPEFQEMIRDSHNDQFDVLIVHKLDRFARDRYDSAHYKHLLKRNGVRVCSVCENLDGSPESIILESMLEGFAEYYSKNLAREVMKGMKENARKGLHTGGKPPFGYDLDKGTKKLVLNEREAQGVKLIFQRVLEGVSYGDIIVELDRLGYRSKFGKLLAKNSIYGILRNRKYVGDYIYNKSREKDCDGKRNGSAYKDESEWIVIPNAIPAIISREDFEAVQKKMALRNHVRNPNRAKETYLLKGKMYCSMCGSAYTGARRQCGAKGDYFVHYGCSLRFRANDSGCTNRQISKPFIEKFVLEHLAEYVFNEEYVSIITAEYNDYLKSQNGELLELQKTTRQRLTAIEKELHTVTELLLQTKAQTLIERLEALEQERIELSSQLEQAQRDRDIINVTEEEVKNLFLKIREKLTSGNLSNIKQVIDSYVQRIEVQPENVVVTFNFFPKINLAMANEKPEGCDTSQPSGLLLQRSCTNVDYIGGERGIRTRGRG